MDSVRRVEPEWLDHLPAADPRALRSRRDLKRVNAMMANAGIVRRALPHGIGRMAEIGAGDGAFALAFARGVRAAPPAELVLVDRQRLVSPDVVAGFARHGWIAQAVEADVFEWLRASGAIQTPTYDAIVANLFLHHFEPRDLATMLSLVAARTRVFIACEPRRSSMALAGSHLLGLVGCNDVTRHDAVVSVRAGFRGRELSSLWPQGRGWAVEEGARGLFSHCFVARRVC